MKACNVGGNKNPGDPHQAVADAFGIKVRKEAKDNVNTPLLHGSAWMTISKELNSRKGEHKEMTPSSVKKHSIDTYGMAVLNIPKIAEFGEALVDNENVSLFWNSYDGMKCQSTAYCKSANMDVYGLSITAKRGYVQTRVFRDMPLYLIKKKGKGEDGKDFNEEVYGKAKTRGLYANITHSIDGWSLREIVRMLVEKDASFIMKHDKFYVLPNNMDSVYDQYQNNLLVEFDAGMYEASLKDIVMNKKGSKPSIPKLYYGAGTRKMIRDSKSFLSA